MNKNAGVQRGFTQAGYSVAGQFWCALTQLNLEVQ